MRLYDYDASGNCLKVRLLLGLLGREYERVPVDIFAGDTLTEEYGRLNPLRETPVLETGGGAVITQSAAILWYLGEGTPYLPPDPVDRARVVQWLVFEQERIMATLAGVRFRVITGRAAADARGIVARREAGRAALDVLEAHLATTPFVVAGAPSIADLALYAYISVAGEAGVELDDRAAVGAWLERLRALPGFEDDLVPYPANAQAGASRSIYDA
ncbi:MAG TPA: glutathione S-transferase family protein [Solirubrobacteraceae bacterium]|nr:glutathione S-transferase family protein [Solirubrobacteraceae bacterium]